MTKMINLKIDGQSVSVPEGVLVVDAAKQIGIDIPVFCYHPKMEPVGMCRMCLVEVGRPMIDRATGQPVLEADGSPKIAMGPKMETACTTPVSEGMVVVGMSEKVKAARKDVVEFILTSHPLDCPICDKGGECPLQNLTMDHGAGESRFLYNEKTHMEKHVPLGDLIYLDRERCIQCARCVRFQADVADDPVIGFFNRGRYLEIATFSDPGFDSYFSGNTTDICPVGALTTADFRFGARPWELRATASVCAQCPVGCNITFNVRREARSNGQVVIKRVMPRQNESVNEIWICDKGRFAYQYTETPERVTQPMLRKNGELVPASWDEALDAAAGKFKNDLLALVSGRLSNEDLYNIQQLAQGVGGKAALYTEMAGGDLVAQFGLSSGSNLQTLGKGSAILVVASDLEEEAPIWWLRVKQAAERGAVLIVANARPTKTDQSAAHVIRYAFGQETATLQTFAKALGLKGAPETTVSAEIKAAAEIFAKAENAVVIYGSDGIGLAGTQALAQSAAQLLHATNHAGRANSGLLAVWQRANDQGAWELGLRPAANLETDLQAARALYIAGANPAGDSPALAAAIRASGAFVVVQDLYLSETAKLADVVLPAQAYTEREGSFTSGERRVQRFFPAVDIHGQARADYTIAAQLGQRLGLTLEGVIPGRVLAKVAAAVPAFKALGANPYRKLAETEAQWPIMGRSDLFYGGTSYENTQGLGHHLALAAHSGGHTWPKVEAEALAAGAMLAVPVTFLYDRGETVLPSTLLQAHIPGPFVCLNPEEATRLRLKGAGGELRKALVELNNAEVLADVRLDETIPVGVVLVPRSMGLPISAPTSAKLRAAERVSA